MTAITLDMDGLDIPTLIAIARDHAPVRLSDASVRRINEARKLVDQWVADGKVIYGITTGFGALSDIIISAGDTRQLQQNILMSHACGTGSLMTEETVRAMMALRIKDMARGNTGVRLETLETLISLLNRNVVPIVPEKGSVGASGDLVPLAHLALVLIGKGEAVVDGQRMNGAEALDTIGVSPLTLSSGEGLALVNGTQAMTAVGALAVSDAVRLARHIDIAAAMSLEVLMGSRMEFDPRIHRLRPHPGQACSADNMLRIIRNSDIISSHKDCRRVQDAYTLRCSPQVHGASQDAIVYARRVIETEMSASTGNPLIFGDTGDYLLGGNFHGQPVALAMDFLGIAVAELGNISERRIERLVNPMLSGLPAFLVKDGGLNSGFMIAQYTAASLVSENKVLSHPASVDSIPTSANKEDHVSMGTIAARKCRDIIGNTSDVVAIEMLCAAQALDLFTNLHPGEGTLAAYRIIRQHVSHLDHDRVMAEDLAVMKRLIADDLILKAVTSAVGPLFLPGEPSSANTG